jgi:hypothetical protein
MRSLFTSVLAGAGITLWVALWLNLLGNEPQPLAKPAFEAPLAEVALFHDSEAPRFEAQQRRLEAKLDQPVQLTYLGARLLDIVEHLGQTLEIQVTVDQLSFEQSDFNLQSEFSVDLPEIRLRSALTLMLQPYDLTWRASDGIVHISPADAVSQVSSAHVFQAERLMRSAYDPAVLDREALPAAIERLVAPESWKANGGDGSLHVYHNALIVHQRGAVIHELRRMLAALKQAADDQDHHPRQAVGRVYRWDLDISAETQRRLQAHLERTAGPMQFSETPLAGVIAWLAQQTGAPLYLDTRAVDSRGNQLASLPISVTLAEQPLRRVLSDLLPPLGLGYQPRHDVIYIDGGGEPQLLARIYPVRDLIDPRAGEQELFWRYQLEVEAPLVTTIYESAELSVIGLPGDQISLTFLESVDCLLVNGSHRRHRDLQQLLHRLREARGRIDYRAHSRQLQAARQGPVHLAYSLSMAFGNRVEPPDLVAAKQELWNRLPAELGSRLEITIRDSSLQIRATMADHRALQELIERTGLPLYQEQPWNHSPCYGGLVPVVG